jgi:hypothetical protein
VSGDLLIQTKIFIVEKLFINVAKLRRKVLNLCTENDFISNLSVPI